MAMGALASEYHPTLVHDQPVMHHGPDPNRHIKGADPALIASVCKFEENVKAITRRCVRSVKKIFKKSSKDRFVAFTRIAFIRLIQSPQ